MRLIYIVGVDVSKAEHTSLNEARTKLGVATRTMDEDVIIAISDALNSKLFHNADVYPRARLTASKDPDANA